MALVVSDVQKKTILESQIEPYLKTHLSINDLQALLQLKDRRPVLRYIVPKDMKMQELFYVPSDKVGRQTEKEEKQLATRYFVPTNIWAEYLIANRWITGVKRRIAERFNFIAGKRIANGNAVVGTGIKSLTVIKTESVNLTGKDVFETLKTYKRSGSIGIAPLTADKLISPTIIKMLAKMCDSFTIQSPMAEKKLTYLDPDHLLHLYNCGFHKTDFVVCYNEKVKGLEIEDRFNFYLKEAIEELPESKKKSRYIENGELLPLNLIPPSNRDLDEIKIAIHGPKSLLEKNILLNELVIHMNKENDPDTLHNVQKLMYELNGKKGTIVEV